jgi:MFS family permease
LAGAVTRARLPDTANGLHRRREWLFTVLVLARYLPPPGPGRQLVLITLANAIGTGCWVVSSALYLTRIVGLPAIQVGLGFSAVALVTLVTSTPLGYLADRYGPRMLQIGFYLALAGCYAAMVFVNSFATFLVVALAAAICDAGQRGARGALIAGTIQAAERVRTRALFRATANLGYLVGAAAAGLALAYGNAFAYRSLIVCNAVSYLVVAMLARRLPRLAPKPGKKSGPRLTALRNRPYLTFVALDGLMNIHTSILALVLPLWIADRTHAPRWMIAVCIIVNTLIVISLQVRTSRGTEELAGAAAAARNGGGLIAAACLIFAVTAGPPAWVAIVILLAGTVVHVLGELRHSAAGWAISFGLAPEHSQGQYQATYAMSAQLGAMVAPALLTWLILGIGRVGWLILAILVALPALAMPATVRWGQREFMADSSDATILQVTE